MAQSFFQVAIYNKCLYSRQVERVSDICAVLFHHLIRYLLQPNNQSILFVLLYFLTSS